MAESLAAIARKLNVAPSTISRALSNPELVAPKTREKILNYVQEIGYQPNLALVACAVNALTLWV